MLITSKAIVLNAIKYGDNDLIVKCYTEQGLRTYLIKRIFKQSKGKFSIAYFQPLTQLEITANYKNNRSLHFINDIKISRPYTTIPTNVVKQTMLVFLSEVLTNALREEEENLELFHYLETAFFWLDSQEEAANFHLKFLMNLTKYLGFYPEKEKQSLYFDLLEGKFTDHITSKHYISGEKLIYFKQLYGTNFEGLDKLKFNKKSRQSLLETLIQYFELHLPGFRKPKSLEVLKMVFN